MSRILGLILGRIFLGISSLGMNTISFMLRLCVLGLGEHILDYEGVLGRLILHLASLPTSAPQELRH